MKREINRIGTLNNLDGISVKKIDCARIEKPSDITAILRKKIAGTAANYNGALNVWRRDDGLIQCNSMAWLKLLESKKFRTIKETEKWIAKWLKKIK